MRQYVHKKDLMYILADYNVYYSYYYTILFSRLSDGRCHVLLLVEPN